MGARGFLSGIPLIGGMFDNSNEEAKKYLNKILREYEGIDAPDVAWQDYNPEMYNFDYTPEQFTGETIKEDPRTIQAQRDYLSRLQGLSESGMSEGDMAGYEMARQMAAGEAKGSRDALARQAMASGTYGSGADMVSRQMANQNAAQMAQQSALQQAQDAARQKALYAQAYGSQLGGMRDQDFRAESSNKDIINRFNQMNTGARNDAALMRQGVGQQNVDQRNQAQLTNQQGRIGQNQAGFNNQLAISQGKAGAYDRMGSFYGNQGAQRAGQRAALGTAVGTAFGGPVGGAVGGFLG